MAILLDRLKFSPGQISGHYNNNLKHAIQAFQSTRGLPSTGDMDSRTWALLNQAVGQQTEPVTGTPVGGEQYSARHTSNPAGSQSDIQSTEPQSKPSHTQALTIYIIALEDVTGPFTPLPRVEGSESAERLILREAKFVRLNYGSPLELLAEKFHSSPSLLIELNPKRKFTGAGQKILVPNVLTPDPAEAASVIVDGSVHGVTAVDPKKFNYNPKLFWDAENKRPRATLPPGPRNPVGIIWIGLSKKHYGIHGTPAPSRIGLTQSHGCIRLTNWDAAELGKIVRTGTPVFIHAN